MPEGEQTSTDRVRLRISAELLEDTHPGSGAGGGTGIDALVSRDRRGLPVIRASHLEGVLRDAARRLFEDDSANELFGSPGGARQSAVFTSLYHVGSDPVTRVWRSSARASFDNRAPKEETLRVKEFVGKGTKLEGQAELPASELTRFKRLFHEVDALGSGRATGAGQIKFTLTNLSTDPSPFTGEGKRLVLLLRNLEPLCMTATATPGNVIPSLAYIPGRSILGSLANWLFNNGRDQAARMLVSGGISVGNALPLPNSFGSAAHSNLCSAEVLPAPLSLQSEKPKGPGGPVPWWAQPPVPLDRLDGLKQEYQDRKLKRPEADLFVFRKSPDDSWDAYRPQLLVRLRNGRPEPDQQDPSLFAVEQIAEQTLFLCEIQGGKEELARLTEAVLPVLEGRRWLRVGRAGAPVEIVKAAFQNAPALHQAGTSAMLTLTSDWLVRDEYLRWRTNLQPVDFERVPGWPKGIQVLKNYIQESTVVYGFNGTSRMRKMPAYGIRRGSIFLVEGSGVAELTAMAAAGQWFGERTHEGFGRFRLDEALPGVTRPEPTLPVQDKPKADTPEEEVACVVARWIAGYSPTGSSPSLSQWGDLVSELEAADTRALESRLHPVTAGGKAWENPAANEILKKIGRLPPADRSLYAHMFVRWLRARARRGNQ